jgi:hypothetical protein
LKNRKKTRLWRTSSKFCIETCCSQYRWTKRAEFQRGQKTWFRGYKQSQKNKFAQKTWSPIGRIGYRAHSLKRILEGHNWFQNQFVGITRKWVIVCFLIPFGKSRFKPYIVKDQLFMTTVSDENDVQKMANWSIISQYSCKFHIRWLIHVWTKLFNRQDMPYHRRHHCETKQRNNQWNQRGRAELETGTMPTCNNISAMHLHNCTMFTSLRWSECTIYGT